MPEGPTDGSRERPSLVLASASPRRLQLLRQVGLDPIRRPADIDETPLAGESATDLVTRLAAGKAEGARPGEGEVALGSDTVVELDGDVLGKPSGRAAFLAMFERLSGREHRVISGVALAGVPADDGAVRRSLVVVTRVRFAIVGPGEAAAYWETGEPADKAGGYAIQGRGARFVEALNGSYSSVVGLPLFETLRLLEGVGIVANRPV